MAITRKETPPGAFLPLHHFQVYLKEMAADIQNGTIRLTFLGDSEKREVLALIEKHGLSKDLRTLDAMQLAVMKTLGLQIVRHIYCADSSFATVIKEEGFSVIDPEEPPETQHER